MGPDGLGLPSCSLQFSDKVPPSFDGYGDYNEYRENVLLWNAMTTVAAERRAPTVIGQLSGQAQVTAKTVPLTKLISEQGINTLLDELDRKFGLDSTTLLHSYISSFFDYTWQHDTSVDEYVVGFHSRLDKISKLELSDELKGHLLLKQANLDAHDRNMIVGAAGGDYSLQAIATSLRNAFRSEGLPLSSMTTSVPNRNSSQQAMHSGPRSMARLSAPPQSKRITRTTENTNDDTLFYTYISAEKTNNGPSAIIDSGACASVVGKRTLDDALRTLEIDQLEDDKPIQSEHQFGPSDHPRKTICTVRVPFMCKDPQKNETVHFKIKFDVIDGSLPFLIGLPSLLAMKATINFQYHSLSLAIRNSLYRLQLVRQSSHLRLPLESEVTHQRALKSLNRSTHYSKRRILSTNHFSHYYTPSFLSKTTEKKDKDHDLSSVELKKIHEQLGHATYSQMQSFLKEARRWNPSYEKELKSVTQNCECARAAPPLPRPVCSNGDQPTKKQSQLSIDIVYFNGKPFMHCIDNLTRWSETGVLRTRRLCDQINVIKRIQFYRHGLPDSIKADQEYNRHEFKEFCSLFDIKLITIAANYHEANSIVERANRTIRNHFNRLRYAEPRSSLVDLVAAATFHKNTSRGNKNASSFELLYEHIPRLSTVCNPETHGTIEDNVAHVRQRQLKAGLKANIRKSHPFCVGEAVYFWRDQHGWVGPGIITKINDYDVYIAHNGVVKTADRFRLRPASQDGGPNNASIDDDDDTRPPDQEEVELPTRSTAADGENQEPPSAQLPRKRRTQAELLADESRAIIQNLPTRRATHSTNNAHMISNAGEPDLTNEQQSLSKDEKTVAYVTEKSSWINNRAYTLVPKAEVPTAANIIGSHVIYKRKADGTAKARIVPWGHKDNEKELVRGDAPSLNLDIMRILISIAAQKGWGIHKMDVKTAYLQARGFNRTIYVRPPREDNDSANLWKLSAPAYGLTDSGRLWYITSHIALTQTFGLTRSRFEPSLYYMRRGESALMLVVQVDDYIYTGTPDSIQNFESFLQSQFLVGTLEAHKFDVMGAHLDQNDKGTITLNANHKLSAIEPVDLPLSKHEKGDRHATPSEVSAYRCLIGKLLYVGRLASPVCAYHASEAAMKCSQLRLHHIKALNATLKQLKLYPAKLSFHSVNGSTFALEAMSDASLRERDSKTNVREGILIFRRSDDIIHPIGWTSRLARRVARSTSTAELLSAADAVDQITYLNTVLKEIDSTTPTELILDSKTTFHLCATASEPQEAKNKIILASIREEHHMSSLATIRWTPGNRHLADALTKNNPVIAKILAEALQTGRHKHPDASYTIQADIPPPRPEDPAICDYDPANDDLPM